MQTTKTTRPVVAQWVGERWLPIDRVDAARMLRILRNARIINNVYRKDGSTCIESRSHRLCFVIRKAKF